MTMPIQRLKSWQSDWQSESIKKKKNLKKKKSLLFSDSTAQYIKGQMVEADADGIVNRGLQCVAVLIGAFQKSTGLPIIGVSIQPFSCFDSETNQYVVFFVVLLCFCLFFFFNYTLYKMQENKQDVVCHTKLVLTIYG